MQGYSSETYTKLPAKNQIKQISVTLDMRTDGNQENGVLSFKLNDKDYGVAYDKIDMNKTYHMATAIYNSCAVRLLQ